MDNYSQNDGSMTGHVTQSRVDSAQLASELAGMLHDLKAPLTVISGAADLMARSQDAAQRQRYLQLIRAQVSLVAEMSRDLLGQNDDPSVVPARAQLGDLLAGLAPQLQMLVGDGVAIDVAAHYAGAVAFDGHKLQRVIQNLVQNAATAMAGAGAIRLSTWTDGQNVWLEVADTGPGIDPDVAERLLGDEPARASLAASGLGLSIVKTIVEQHGGEVTLASTPGRGAAFRLRLPRAAPPRRRSRRSEARPRPASAASIICITDDPRLRRVLQRSVHHGTPQVQFLTSADAGAGAAAHRDAQVLFVDGGAKRALPLPDLAQSVGARGDLVVLGESLEDETLALLLRDTALDHLIGGAGPPDEHELAVTSVKLLSGDIFGVEKYLTWGTRVHELCATTYEEKRVARLAVTDHARRAGVRLPLIHRIDSVTDELLMNAMYDAPQTGPEDPGLARVRYACDARHFAVSVEDDHGRLRKETILDHWLRARQSKGHYQPSETTTGGAGLGLYFILSHSTKFIANIDQGKRTEVICLFDVRQKGRDMPACASSLHYFTAPRPADPPSA
jgi:signal transduction histidine kinase